MDTHRRVGDFEVAIRDHKIWYSLFTASIMILTMADGNTERICQSFPSL